ncbi:unnamed protein product [Moneuplotes crassus]|uniref:Uncharacterized protein n=1 Tax=Euplotes crassus TaxID=5936 RepID=A0AAD1XFT8_EUPCR|nr:unnamed protein product [Moneuplotes crassus]
MCSSMYIFPSLQPLILKIKSYQCILFIGETSREESKIIKREAIYEDDNSSNSSSADEEDLFEEFSKMDAEKETKPSINTEEEKSTPRVNQKDLNCFKTYKKSKKPFARSRTASRKVKITGNGAKSKRKQPIKKLCVNVAYTRYKIVRYVAKKIFGYRLSKSDSDEWDICWLDAGISHERLFKMKAFQRINHFPGMYAIARKNLLARNLMKMQDKFPNEYDFFPKTWSLPAEMCDFKLQFQNANNKRKANNPTFICKPEAACQGRGIFLMNNLNKIPTKDNYIAQKYITNPYIIDNLKFDLRLYVLICGVDPLRIYLYDDGLARFATHKYKKPTNKNLKNSFIHLTNYAINKNSAKYESNTGLDSTNKGHKRSYKSILEHMRHKGEDVEKLQEDIEAGIIKTLCCIQPSLAHAYRSCQPEDVENSMCFEILGFDILIDQKLKPWVIEINTSPSFHVDTPLDYTIKKGVIEESIRLLNLSYNRKLRFKKKEKTEFQRRVLSGKIRRQTQEERIITKQDYNSKRNAKELKVVENFKLIYPNFEMEVYENFMSTAKIIWEEFTGSSNKPNKSEKKRKDRLDSSIINPPKVAIMQKVDNKTILKPKRRRPASAYSRQKENRFTKSIKETQIYTRTDDDTVMIKKEKITYQPSIVNLMPIKTKSKSSKSTTFTGIHHSKTKSSSGGDTQSKNFMLKHPMRDSMKKKGLAYSKKGRPPTQDSRGVGKTRPPSARVSMVKQSSGGYHKVSRTDSFAQTISEEVRKKSNSKYFSQSVNKNDRNKEMPISITTMNDISMHKSSQQMDHNEPAFEYSEGYAAPYDYEPLNSLDPQLNFLNKNRKNGISQPVINKQPITQHGAVKAVNAFNTLHKDPSTKKKDKEESAVSRPKITDSTFYKNEKSRIGTLSITGNKSYIGYKGSHTSSTRSIGTRQKQNRSQRVSNRSFQRQSRVEDTYIHCKSTMKSLFDNKNTNMLNKSINDKDSFSITRIPQNNISNLSSKQGTVDVNNNSMVDFEKSIHRFRTGSTRKKIVTYKNNYLINDDLDIGDK